MRIVAGGQLLFKSSNGNCTVEKQPTTAGFEYRVNVYDHKGTWQASATVPTRSFVDLRLQGEGPYRVELDTNGGSSVHIEVDAVGAEDTVCIVNDGTTGMAGMCSAPPR